MADISDGTYIIRSVANTALSINVKGATGGNGTNVWAYTVNKLHDGCYCSVATIDDGNGNEWRLLSFPCTGKNVSVSCTSSWPAAGEYNVYQWDKRGETGGGEQKWAIEDTGTTTTFDSETYGVYEIAMYVTKDGTSPYTREILGISGTVQSGANISVNVDSDASKQRWIFEPVDAIFPGTYKVVSRTNTGYGMYVNGASKSAGARVGVQPFTGDLNQIWHVSAADSGRIQVRPVHSFGDLATYATNTATSGDQCCQDGHSAAQTDHWWVPKPQANKAKEINGTSYTFYNLTIYAGNDLNLDLNGNSLKNWLQIWTENTTDAQLWAFVPVEPLVQTLPVPTGAGITFGGGTFHDGTAVWDSSTPIYPVWECPGTRFQCRYRTRVIGVSDTGTETYPFGWSGWMSVADGSESNDGWGTCWLPNQEFSTPADSKVSTDALVLDALTATYPACDIEVEVRYFTDSWSSLGLPAHGPSASGSVRVYDPMAVTVSGVTRTGDGLVVSFTSDWAVGATTATVRSLTTTDSATPPNSARMLDPVTESGKYAAADTVTVPWGDIDQFVAVGDSVTLEMELVTALGVAGSITYTGTIADGGDLGVTPTYSETAHATYSVKVPHASGASTRLLCLRAGERPLEIGQASTSASYDMYDVLVPLNTSGTYEVIVSGFAVAKLTLPEITSHFCVWTFGSGDWAVLDWGRGKRPEQDDRQAMDADEYQLTAREYHAYRQNASMKRDLSVVGAIVESMPEHGSRAAFMRLLEEGHAVYRNLRGEIHSVFVSDISIPLEDSGSTDVKVTQHSETR